MNCVGLVLCGGMSSRMGTDKAFIQYHQTPQWLHMYNMLQQICEDVFISCNLSQVHHFSSEYKIIVDHPLYANAGPMTGLLSTFHQHPENSLLVVGCDYPKLILDDLKNIQQHIDEDKEVICYRNLSTGIDEPLIAWYHHHTFKPMLNAYNHEQKSLRQFIDTQKTLRLLPDEWNRMFSVDTPEQRITLE